MHYNLAFLLRITQTHTAYFGLEDHGAHLHSLCRDWTPHFGFTSITLWPCSWTDRHSYLGTKETYGRLLKAEKFSFKRKQNFSSWEQFSITHVVVLVLWSIKNGLPLGACRTSQPLGRIPCSISGCCWEDCCDESLDVACGCLPIETLCAADTWLVSTAIYSK